MIRLLVVFYFIFALAMVSEAFAADIMLGKWKVAFPREMEVPSQITIAINKYKTELNSTNNIEILKDKLENTILAQGYYDVDLDVNKNSLTIVLGKPYKISKVNYFLNNKLLKKNDPINNVSNVLAENIELTKKVFLNNSAKEYCIFNHKGDVKLNLDKRNKLLIVNYYIEGTDDAIFGDIKINTQNKISKEFVEKKLTFKEQQCYKFNRVDNSKFNLLKTGVFTDVKMIQTQRESTKYIDINIETDIENSKKLESMLEFSTQDKIAGSFNFSNRNFRSKGEKLGFLIRLSKQNKEAKLEHKSSNSLLENTVSYNVETTDLQKEKSLEYLINKSHVINSKNTIITGFGIENSDITLNNLSEKEKTIIYSVPILYELKLNAQDDNYTKHAFSLKLSNSKKHKFFYITGYQFQKYIKLFTKKNYYLSFNTAINKSHGNNIPLTEKTYLGGMNSIRGYKYETVGVFENNKNVPAIGHYFLKTELSYRFYDNWGAGVFYDIGRLSNKKIFKFNNMIDATGISVKYYINDLPISFDLAFPLKKKYAGKTKYEFYLNMGFNF